MSKLEELFGKMEDTADVKLIENEAYVGFRISFTLKNFGFGEVVLAFNKEKNVWQADTERMSAETIEKILVLAAPQIAKLMISLDP